MVKIILKLLIDVASFSKTEHSHFMSATVSHDNKMTFQQKLWTKSLQMFDIQSSTLIYGAIRDHEPPFKKS